MCHARSSLKSRLLAATACVLAASCATDAQPPRPATDGNVTGRGAPPTGQTAGPLDGLWSGSWGGGGRDGIVMQPVLAELWIDGDHGELTGFPTVGSLHGTLRVDAGARLISIIPGAAADGSPPSETINYTYELKAESLTLTGSDGNVIALGRRPTARDPLADVQVEFVTASAINDAGNLVITEFRWLRTGQDGKPWYERHELALNTQRATVLLVQESTLKEISNAEARPLVRESTPVVMVFTPDNPEQDLSQPAGSAVRQVLARMLRPGTLVFILPESDRVPPP